MTEAGRQSQCEQHEDAAKVSASSTQARGIDERANIHERTREGRPFNGAQDERQILRPDSIRRNRTKTQKRVSLYELVRGIFRSGRTLPAVGTDAKGS